MCLYLLFYPTDDPPGPSFLFKLFGADLNQCFVVVCIYIVFVCLYLLFPLKIAGGSSIGFCSRSRPSWTQTIEGDAYMHEEKTMEKKQ